MATLRNKTTESGTIVRWKPHPDHTRPSTYQVTPRAVSFLADLGFSVPFPGDETDLPWDLCRTLRILGDLHFKSESPGRVNTGDVAEVPDTYGQSLDEDQRRSLRQYIESHENYGRASDSLQGEISSLPEGESEDDSECFQTRYQTRNPSNVDLLKSPTIVYERVQRISAADNAIVESESGTSYNLGPLSEDSVGEIVPAVPIEGEWAFCIDGTYWTDRYVDFFQRRVRSLSNKLPREILTAMDHDSVSATSDLSAYDFDYGDSVTVQVFGSGGESQFGKYGDYIVRVRSDRSIPEGPLTTTIVGTRGPFLVVEPVVEDGPGEGDIITIEVMDVTEDENICRYGGIVVRVPGGNLTTGDELGVAVTEIRDEDITASVTAIPESMRPTIGEWVLVENETLVESPTIPVSVPSILSGVWGQYRLPVARVADDHVDLQVSSIEELTDVSLGDSVPVEVVTWIDDGAIATRDDVPYLIDGFQTHFTGECRVVVEGTERGVVRASFEEPVSIDDGGTVDEYIQMMVSGYERVAKSRYVDAARDFGAAADISLNVYTPLWIDARTSEAYTVILEVIDEENVDASPQILGDLRRDLRSVEDDDEAIVEFCIREVEALEKVVEAARKWRDATQTDVTMERRKARAETKRILRSAVDLLVESNDDTNEFEIDRRTTSPLVVRALEIVVGRVGNVHDEVSRFVRANDRGDNLMWTPIVQLESLVDRRRSRLVVPFDPPANISTELRRLRTRAERASEVDSGPIAFRNVSREYRRTEAICEYIRYRAGGTCEACKNDAPFVDTRDRPYIELHHVDEFEIEGPNRPDRVVALCPTCHARVHAGADGVQYNDELREKLERGLGNLGTGETSDDTHTPRPE